MLSLVLKNHIIHVCLGHILHEKPNAVAPLNGGMRRAFISAMLLFHLACIAPVSLGQITVLSEESAAETWRTAQVEALQAQLGGARVAGTFRQELQAQLKWLRSWTPGELSRSPVLKQVAAVDKMIEPTLDPDGLATKLRNRLFGSNAKPTAADTQELQRLLPKNPDDLGLRQLHLHWLDQPQYRKQYSDAIVDACNALLELLGEAAESDENQLVASFSHYRRVRALAYRELPDVVAANPIEDPEAHATALHGAYAEFKANVDGIRPEFVLVDVRMLRKDKLLGKALALLEAYGGFVEPKWLLKKRRDILSELGWQLPYEEAAALYAVEFPAEVAKEAEQAEKRGKK